MCSSVRSASALNQAAPDRESHTHKYASPWRARRESPVWRLSLSGDLWFNATAQRGVDLRMSIGAGPAPLRWECPTRRMPP